MEEQPATPSAAVLCVQVARSPELKDAVGPKRLAGQRPDEKTKAGKKLVDSSWALAGRQKGDGGKNTLRLTVAGP